VLEALAHRLACGIQTPPPAATVLVQLSLDELGARLAGARLLDDTGTLPAAVARRLCCDAQLIPTVLDGRSVPLDLGRSARFFSTAQRHALAVRDPAAAPSPAASTPHRLQRPPPGRMGNPHRTHQPGQRGAALPAPPPHRAPARLDRPHRTQRPTRIPAPTVDRPAPKTPTAHPLRDRASLPDVTLRELLGQH